MLYICVLFFFIRQIGTEILGVRMLNKGLWILRTGGLPLLLSIRAADITCLCANMFVFLQRSNFLSNNIAMMPHKNHQRANVLAWE